jgi:hypothetical protein
MGNIDRSSEIRTVYRLSLYEILRVNDQSIADSKVIGGPEISGDILYRRMAV